MTKDNARAAAEIEAIEYAISTTEYKYFGDYELSADQREAVDQLVLTARRYLASLRTDTQTKEGDDAALIADANSWYSGYQIAEMKDADGILPCECGTHPHLYGDGAHPDDGYRSLFCQGCAKHVTEMHRTADAAIRAWNAERESALSEPLRPSQGEGTAETVERAVAAERERCARAVRDTLIAMDWPPEDGDAEIDALLEAIGFKFPCPICGDQGWITVSSPECCGGSPWECGGRGCTGPVEKQTQQQCEACAAALRQSHPTPGGQNHVG